MLNKKYSGFTMVELMVAMVLGLMVVGVVTTVFLSGTRHYAQDERYARMQENGRYVIRLLMEEISNVDYWGGMTTISSIQPNIVNPGPPESVIATANCGVNFGGTTALQILNKTTGTTANTTFSCISASTFRNNTDVVLVQRVYGAPASLPGASPSPNPYDLNKAYLRTNMTVGKLVKTTAVPTTELSSSLTIPSQSWTYWEYRPQVFYIQDTGKPTLHRKFLKYNGTSFIMDDQALVEGVESFHILFGIDTDADGVANQYLANPTTAQLKNAVNARVYVLARSLDKDPGHNDQKTYQLGDICYNVAGDNGCSALTDASTTSEPEKYHRRVFASTVMLRNPAYLLQLSP